MAKTPNHYHVMAYGTHIGKVVEHFHTTLGGSSMRRHEHEGLVGYATSRRKAEQLSAERIAWFRAKYGVKTAE